MNNRDKMKKLIEVVGNDKWAVSFQWSQTERGTALVWAKDRDEAQRIVKEKLPGIHHTTGASKIDYEF